MVGAALLGVGAAALLANSLPDTVSAEKQLSRNAPCPCITPCTDQYGGTWRRPRYSSDSWCFVDANCAKDATGNLRPGITAGWRGYWKYCDPKATLPQQQFNQQQQPPIESYPQTMQSSQSPPDYAQYGQNSLPLQFTPNYGANYRDNYGPFPPPPYGQSFSYPPPYAQPPPNYYGYPSQSPPNFAYPSQVTPNFAYPPPYGQSIQYPTQYSSPYQTYSAGF